MENLLVSVIDRSPYPVIPMAAELLQVFITDYGFNE
jgi:hypothetical protein